MLYNRISDLTIYKQDNDELKQLVEHYKVFIVFSSAEKDKEKNDEK